MKSSLLISGALSMAMLTACTPQQWIERRVESAVTNAMDEISKDSVDVRRKPGTQLRIATFNTSMFDDADGGLLTRLRLTSAQGKLSLTPFGPKAVYIGSIPGCFFKGSRLST